MLVHTCAEAEGVCMRVVHDCIMDVASDTCVFQSTTIDSNTLKDASEVFVCDKWGAVIPVTSIDGVVVGDGARGSVTKRIQDVFTQCIHNESIELTF